MQIFVVLCILPPGNCTYMSHWVGQSLVSHLIFTPKHRPSQEGADAASGSVAEDAMACHG